MSDLPIHTNGTHQHNEEPNGSLKNSQANSIAPKIQIQVTTKKKKQVINLQSSSERARSRQGSSPKPADLSVPKQSKKSKVKKSQHKCQLCKATGKKVQMKKCTSCKHYTHLHCLDQNQGKGKYTCDRCKAAQHSQESKAIKKVKKLQEKIEQNKATQKKMEKQKKKDESNKILQKMKEKYPYYIGEGDKIKFPIQDKLLFIYKQYFEVSEPKVFPTNHPLIPGQYLGDLLQIQNFIASFGKQIEQDYSGDFRKSVLYILMNCKGSDKTFEQLLGAIIKIYLKDIFEKNKTENVKILNDNAFFILLGTINQAQQMTSDYVAMTAPQIIRHLSNVPSMRNSFQNFKFPQTLNLDSKLKIVVSLIQGLSEVDGFHDMVSRKSEKISQMTKDKADNVVKLKKNQAEALSNKEKLKEYLGKNNKPSEDQNQVQQEQVPKDKTYLKQLEKLKKKTQKLATEGEYSQKIIKQFKTKIVQITRKIPFVISEILFLGVDRNNSQYFFYLKQPHRIYVRYHNFLLDDNEQFKVFESKEKITQFMKSLNTKGVHQKRLYQSIHNLVKEQIIRNLTLQDDLKQTGTQIEPSIGQCVFLESDNMFRQKVINDVMEIQEKFSNYLTIKNYRWANDAKREQFRFGFPYIQDVGAMKEQIKNLQESFLFVEVIRQKQLIRADQSGSEQEIDKEVNQSGQKQLSRRKKPIRIWGINSERIKKFWVEYLESCINYTGIWISVSIFKNYVDKYLEKKLQHIRQQERKENYLREKQLKERKLREQKEREKQERNLDRLRSRDKPKILLKKNREVAQIDEDEEESSNQGVKTRRRLLRPSNRSRGRPSRDQYQHNHHRPKLTIDSDEQQYENSHEQNSHEQIQIQDEQSQNDDQCAICHDIGQVICCDTCPKVFHLECLGLKETPDGQWSCIDCLHKINNQRQTRSRSKKMGGK